MEKFEKGIFKRAINLTMGTPFQEFICELFEKLHGPEEFLRLRMTSDEGADGVFKSALKVIACYGPKKYDKSDFGSKVKDDYKKFKSNWKKHYPGWIFIFNQELSPDSIKIFSKKKDSELMGVDQIILQIEKLNCFQRTYLGGLIGLEKDMFNHSIVKELIIKLVESHGGERLEYSKPSYIKNKIEKNFSPDEIQSANDDYLDSLSLFPIIKTVLSQSTDSAYLSNFKTVIKLDFETCSGSFKTRLYQLINIYKTKYGGDESVFYIKALIFYCFEQCFIGEKVQEEIDEDFT